VVARAAVTLTDLLVDELLGTTMVTHDGVRRRVVLWLDPDREFGRLWPSVAHRVAERGARALECDKLSPSQLQLKLDLLALESESDGAAVVYLPGFDTSDLAPRRDGTAPDLWAPYEYLYKGAIWSLDGQAATALGPTPPTLHRWLETRGLRLADQRATTRLTEGGRDSLLARYAEMQLDRAPSEWPSPLKESEIVARLGGDARDALRALIAAPTNALKLWGESTQLTLNGITVAYGLTLPTAAASAEEVADGFSVQLALAEAWDALGRPTDFPFSTRLPKSEELRRQAAQFLRSDVLQDMELGPRYKQRMLRLEKDVDLSRWAASKAGQPRGLPLLARARWSDFLARFDALARSDWRKAAQLLLESADAIASGRTTSWDGVEGDTHWFVLEEARSLLVDAGAAVADVGEMRRAELLVNAYIDRWWEIDHAHLRVRAACSQISGLQHVRRVADLAYFECTSAINDRFTELVEVEATWPPAGLASATILGIELWSETSARKAVIIADGLRWDLARNLQAAFPSMAIHSLAATIPSKTAFGMAAMLPIDSSDLNVVFDKGVLIRTSDGANLSTRDGRKALLAARLPQPGGKPRVGFVDLEDLLNDTPLPALPVTVVFDNTIDEQGHKVAHELPGLADQLTSKLRRAVERLHGLGVSEVHVVTDHGFLLLPADMVNGLGRPSVALGQVVRREERWCALKPDSPVAGLIRLTLPMSSEPVLLGFPRGVRTLVESGDYCHGGISLQETVIPHLVSIADVGTQRLNVAVTSPVTVVVTGTISVILRPVRTSLFMQQAARVRLWVEREAESAGDTVAEPVDIEVRADVEELKPPLYLKEGAHIEAGTALTLRAIDLENGRDLASISLRMGIDWD
jgi:PglZ domain